MIALEDPVALRQILAAVRRGEGAGDPAGVGICRFQGFDLVR